VDVSLVIPAYNESENLPPLVSQCDAALAAVEGEHEIVIVDDGSTDATPGVLARLQPQHPRLRTITHEAGHNIGCHPSELEALRTTTGDVALFLPADLQIRPSCLPLFLDAAQRADVVASRRVNRADNVFRRVASAANNVVERLVMGVDVHDAHSSMLLTRRALADVVPLVVSNSALIPAEILLRARRAGLRITEIDVPHYPRATGLQTGISISEIARVQIDLLRLRLRLAREQRASSS
jgi:glycosyltransferase involved in cell wall biosynthesis